MKSILYYSCLVSDSLLSEIIRQCNGKNLPTQSIQKFHKLLTTGINKKMDVCCISSIPFSNKNIDLTNINLIKDSNFHYTSRYNKSNIIRQMLNFLMSFYYTLKVGKKKKNIAIFDYLNFSVSFGGYLACKILGIKTIIIITDFPDLMVNESVSKFVTRLKYKWVDSFDGYILLSEHMNEIVNKNQKPYLIMEGLVDSEYLVNDITSKEKIVLYAGGLYEKYGIKKLVDAFLLTQNDYELHLYGKGDAVEYIQKKAKENRRVKYFGVVENKVIVEKISNCSLLVNPRPSNLILSRYSFPSKNMEYMLSGTPLLTTKLPSIPNDHYPYVYFIEDETVEGFKISLNKILTKDSNELIEMGRKSNEFVLRNKSNIVQGDRIYHYINNNFL